MTAQYETFLHRWMEEVWNQKSEDAIDELFAEDGIANGLNDADGNPLRGPAGFKTLHRNFLSAFPDLHITVEDTVSEGDKVTARCRLTATHAGEGLGVAPTNEPIEFTGIAIVQLRDGKIIEAWNEFDFLKVYSQVGAVTARAGLPAKEDIGRDAGDTFLHRWFEEAWNQGREEAIDEMVDPDVIAYGLTDAEGVPVSGREDFRNFFRNFRSAFPDIHVDIEETIREGDKIGAVCRVTATHKGHGLGFAATGNRTEFRGILMVRLRDGKIAEAWNYFDFMTLFGQLGVLSITPPEVAGVEVDDLNYGYETFIHRWAEEAWNKGREEAIDEMIDPDVIGYGLKDDTGSEIAGKEAFREFYRKFRSAFPDIHVEVGESVVEGDKVSSACRMTGTYSGEGLAFPVSNNALDVNGILMVRLKDGKMIEAWNYFDFATAFGRLQSPAE
jgi:steroid delta-isomerase-like uncharacterized protein